MEYLLIFSSFPVYQSSEIEAIFYSVTFRGVVTNMLDCDIIVSSNSGHTITFTLFDRLGSLALVWQVVSEKKSLNSC